MNFLLVGGAVLSAILLSPDAPKAPAETTVSAPVQQPASQPQNPESPQKAAQAPTKKSEDRGWMTRETSVDQKTGETTEISVIGFAD